MPYCRGCNTRWIDTGCGQDREHADCPRPCGICGLLMTGREHPGACEGHTVQEARDHVERLRRRRALAPWPPKRDN